MRKETPLKYTEEGEKTMERSILLFKNSVKSEHSYKTYVDKLNRFMEFAGVSSYDELTREKNLQELLEDWIMTIKQQISPNSVPYYFYAIKSFLEVNDVELRWKKIIRLFPAKEKKTGRKPYTTKEVQKILAVAKDLRSRALVLFLASSGVRIGAIPDLRVSHLVDLPLSCKGVLVYEGSTEEYWTIITPEASEALNQYLEKRKSDGENITPNSPLFRESYSAKRGNASRVARPIGLRALICLMIRLVDKSGIRCNEEKKNNRYPTMVNHAFRKRFVTILKNTPEIKNSTAEKLAGHKVYRDEENFTVELDYSYNVPTLENLFNQYKYAIPELSIDDMARVQMKEQQIQKQYSALEEEKRRHFEDKKKLYKTIMERAKSEGKVPDWLRSLFDELILTFE